MKKTTRATKMFFAMLLCAGASCGRLQSDSGVRQEIARTPPIDQEREHNPPNPVDPACGSGGCCGSAQPVDEANTSIDLMCSVATFRPINLIESVDRAVMLTDPLIIDDRRVQANLSFGEELAKLSGAKQDFTAFVLDWLKPWFSGVVSSNSSALLPDPRNRDLMKYVICPWRDASSGTTDCRPGKLDPAKAPFKLTAIANRMDLDVEAQCEEVGELRLVYSLVVDGQVATKDPFNIVFEYAISEEARSISDWVSVWGQLSAIPCSKDNGCNEFITALIPTIDAAAKAENLRHIRTHERLMGPSQFREFDLISMSDTMHLLFETAETTPTNPELQGAGPRGGAAKCLTCHADTAHMDGRFNVMPRPGGGVELHSAVASVLSDRMGKINAKGKRCQGHRSSRFPGQGRPW